MNHQLRRLVVAALFLGSLFTEWLIIAPRISSISSEDFGKFMTISMGLAFLPAIIALLLAIAGLALLVLLAMVPPRIFWSLSRPT